MSNMIPSILLGWCDSNTCGEPIRGVAGQRCPKLCLPCAIRKATGLQKPGGHADDPDELILGSTDYRQLKDFSEEDEGNF